jgi:shikimate dehydrogenase
MIKTAVIGHPIAHSKSPLIHGYWMKQHGIDGTYEAIDIAPEDLSARLHDLANQGYGGVNVTVPHKEAVYDLCDDLDDAAQKIGAVNTVVFKGGKIHGRNTDAFGFMENLRQSQPEYDFTEKTALVLGAGGAARAVVYGLLQAGVSRIVISNRTESRARVLCDMNPKCIDVLPWSQHDLAAFDIIVNTTSLGMTGKPGLDIDLGALHADAVVADIVYAPLMTDLLKRAQARGNPVVTGIGMLLHQARPAFEAWHGVMPDVDGDLEGLVLG